MRRPIKAVIWLLALALAQAAAPRPASAQTQVVEGTYTNTDYGFSLTIPATVAAVMAKPPLPNHGIHIDLGGNRSIEVSAEFDAAMLGSAEAYLNLQLADQHATAIARSPATLAGKPGAEVSALAGGKPEILLALRRDADGGIFYRAALITDAAHRRADTRLFHHILASFREQNLPN